jgi:hypothetical protein
MTKLHGAESAPKPTAALCKELDLKGTLHVLRRGFKFYGKIFRMVYFKPVHGLNPDILDLYAQNRLAITRQIPCHPGERKNRGPRLRPQRSPRRHLRTQKPHYRPDLATPSISISTTANPARPCSASKNAPSSTLPSIPTKST